MTNITLKITLFWLAIAQWVCLAGCVLFTWLFYSLYWQYRAYLSVEERYYHPEEMVVYHADSQFFLVPALLCMLGFLLIHYVMACTRRKAANATATKVP